MNNCYGFFSTQTTSPERNWRSRTESSSRVHSGCGIGTVTNTITLTRHTNLVWKLCPKVGNHPKFQVLTSQITLQPQWKKPQTTLLPTLKNSPMLLCQHRRKPPQNRRIIDRVVYVRVLLVRVLVRACHALALVQAEEWGEQEK